MKNDFCGHENDDVISYVSALANMEGGHLVVGVEDKTLKIVGTDTYNILKELKEDGAVSLKGLSWYEVKNPTKKD